MVTMLTLASECQDRPLRRRSGSAVLWAAALTLTVTLAGCATDPEPQPTPTAIETITETPTPAPTPSETVEVTEPSEPDPSESEPNPAPTPPDPSQLINENTEEGAKSAVQYFLELRQYTFEARDDTLWKDLSTAECEFCTDTTALVNEIGANNLAYSGGKAIIQEFRSVQEWLPEYWIVEVEVEEAASSLLTQEGEVSEYFESSTSNVVGSVRFVDGNWLLDEIAK